MATKRFRILLVEDDLDIARGVSARLSAAGHAVVAAHDGQAGLAAAVQERPDAMILDLRLPVMDGLTVLDQLRKRPETTGIPVVVLSASVGNGGKRRALELGARYFLGKPYQPAQLLDALEAVLTESKRGEGERPNDELATGKDRSGGGR